MMRVLEKIQRHGLLGSAAAAGNVIWRRFRPTYHQWRFSNAPRYADPSLEELATIERDLRSLQIEIHDYAPEVDRFKDFQNDQWFPTHYHDGLTGGVWDEKLLEHWIAAERLDLLSFDKDDSYVDVAAGGSPWTKALRERLGLKAFAIDLAPIPASFRDLPYYRSENATRSCFPDNSIRGASLQCAYEMFMGQDDSELISELARILKPGGKAVILPLYMHTHHCAYATAEYFGRSYADVGAKEYVRFDCYGVPSSRKYDAATLKKRVLNAITEAGLKYRLLALRNKGELGSNIYCHFILEIEK